jgi:hypothetical protein
MAAEPGVAQDGGGERRPWRQPRAHVGEEIEKGERAKEKENQREREERR